MRRRGTMVGDPKIQVFIIYDFGLFYKFYGEKTREFLTLTDRGGAGHIDLPPPLFFQCYFFVGKIESCDFMTF